MIPVLYDKNASEFDTFGMGALTETIKAIVTENRNGSYELTLQYPVTGARFSQLSDGCIIKAKPNEMSDPQLFRIYRNSKPINGIVTYYAQHISYDLNGLPLAGFKVTNSTAQAAINQGLENTPFEHNFSVLSDIATLGSAEIKEPCSVRGILGGKKGSILDVWGGEYEFDNFVIKLHQQRGNDNGVTVEYGKNLTDITQERNITDTYTHLMPYAVYNRDDGNGSSTEVYVYLDEKVIAFPNAENIGHSKAYIMNFSDQFGDNEIPTQALLRQKANAFVSANPELGIPKVSINVSFVQLWQTEEYKNIAPLERVSLCDTVTVKFSKLGISAKAKVIKTVYDSLKEKYESVTLGDAKSSFADTIIKYNSDITDIRNTIKRNQSQAAAAWADAIARATAAITGQSGGYVMLNPAENPQEILILDADSGGVIEDAVKVWRFNSGGLGYSSTGYEGPYTTAITMDGEIVADFIKTGSLDGGLIRARSISADAISASELLLAFNNMLSSIKINAGSLEMYNNSSTYNQLIAALKRVPGSGNPMLQFLSPGANYDVGAELTDLGLQFRTGVGSTRKNGAYYANDGVQTNGGSISTEGGNISTTKTGGGVGGNVIVGGNLSISGSGSFSYHGDEKDTNEFTVYLPATLSPATSTADAQGQFIATWYKFRFKFTDGILTTWDNLTHSS